MMVLVALGTISAVITAAILTSTAASRNYAALDRLVETDALAISGFNRLEAAMLDPADDLETRALQLDSSAEIAVGDQRIALRIEGVGGKIDPVRTDPDVIVHYLANAQLSAAEQTNVMNAIGMAREAGSGNSGYDAMLIGLLDREADRVLQQDFTQFADHSGIDPAYASQRVIAAIPDLPMSPAGRNSGRTMQGLAQLNLQSRYFAPNGARFSLVARVDWGPNQSSQRRLPVEVSSAGRLIPIAGPS